MCFFCAFLCGASRDRTDDLLLAKQMLSQLSYSPKKQCMKFITDIRNIQHICIYSSFLRHLKI